MIVLILGFFLIVALGMLVVMFTEMMNFVQTRVPFVPTAEKDIADMVKRVGITKDDFVIDLGSGNGKVPFVVEALTGAGARGLQKAGWTQWYALAKKLLTRSKIELISGDFFLESWSDATVVYSYLYPPLMRSVGAKFKEDCKPCTKLVCRDFPVPNMTAIEQWQTPTGHTMYLYLL